MICYMPFTYIPEQTADILTRMLGPIDIVLPMKTLMPEHLRSLQEKGRLSFLVPPDLNHSDLQSLTKAFKAWAELHKGGIGDLAVFLKASHGNPPLVDETDPTQIGNQIRGYGQSSPDQGADPLLRAGLLMSLAHEYDAQQNRLSDTLASVNHMERQMFDQIAGRQGRLKNAGHPGMIPHRQFGSKDTGIYMAGERLQAWATLACQCDSPHLGYVTTSRTVFENLLEKFPDATCLGRWSFGTAAPSGGTGDGQLIAERRAKLKVLAHEPNLQDHVDESAAPSAGDSTAALTFSLFGMAACSPPAALRRLAKNHGPHRQVEDKPDAPVNTIFGLFGHDAI